MELLFNFQHPGFEVKDGHFIETECKGTLIHGTGNPAHLVPSFMNAARHTVEYAQMVSVPNSIVPSEAFEDDEHEFWRTDQAQELVIELMDILDGYAPEGYYFGAHEGNGSDYGFWEFTEEDWI